MKKFAKLLSVVLCLAMVLSFATVAFAQAGQTFVKVTDVAELAVGDQVIFVADDEDFALATKQNKNNRGAAAITRNGDRVTVTDEVQVVTLEAGAVEGTFAFSAGNGYLYAASSAKNYLRTEETLSANSSWLITIADGATSVVAQGENARNVMQYNPNDGSPLFSCYDSAKMSALSIYKLVSDGSEAPETPVEPEQPEKPEEPAAVAVTLEEAIAIGGAMEHNTFTEGKYIVTGVITEIASTVWGNMYIQDDAGNRLYIYGLYSADGSARFDVMDPQPAVGDTITVVGILGQYNGNPQMKNGWVTELIPGEKEEEPETPVEPEIPADTKVTIEEANAIGGAMEHNTFTAGKYIVTGVIVEIKSTTYGNMYIEDEAGNRLYIYGVYNADGSARFDVMDPQPAVGDTITVVGILGQYNGNPQMKNGWVTELIPGEKEEEPETPDVPVEPEEPEEPEIPAGSVISLDKANEIGAAMEHNTFTTGKYIVTGVITEITSDVWGNMYIEDTAGNRLFIYGLYSADGSVRYDALESKPVVGDTITVVGVLGQYNGNPQMKNAWLCETPSDTGDSILAAVCAMVLSGVAVVALPKKREF